MKSLSIENIFAGKIKDIKDTKGKKYQSSYKKEPITEEVFVTFLGLKNDTQTDKGHHGGFDKAICVYSKKNYAYFKKTYNIDLPLCAFGENITLSNTDDKDICLGDQYSNGSLIVEVSQPRQPCWKISSILNIKKLTSLVVKEAKTGFYFRVIKEGYLYQDKPLELILRPHKDINIEFINQAPLTRNEKDIECILECKVLAGAFRIFLEKKIKNKKNIVLEKWQEEGY